MVTIIKTLLFIVIAIKIYTKTWTGRWTWTWGNVGWEIRDNSRVNNCSTTCFIPGGHCKQHDIIIIFFLNFFLNFYFILSSIVHPPKNKDIRLLVITFADVSNLTKFILAFDNIRTLTIFSIFKMWMHFCQIGICGKILVHQATSHV